MKRFARANKILLLSFILAVFCHNTGMAGEKITLMTTGEDFTEEAQRFNLSQNEYDLVVTRDKFINWRRAANRFRYFQTLSANSEAEQPMDLAIVDNNWLPALIQNGWLTDLSGLKTDKKRFLPCLIDAATQQGRLYAVPFSTKGLVLFYRRDFHEAHGLDPPQSLDKLVENCRVLIAREHLDHGLTIHYSAIHLDVLPFIWSGGGDVLTEGKASLNSPAIRTILDTFRELAQEGILPNKHTFSLLKKEYRAALTQFTEGRSAYLISWNSRVTELDQSVLMGKYGVMPVPSFKKGQEHYSVIGSWYFVVPENSLQKKGALAFLDFIYSDPMQVSISSMRPGFVPAIRDVKGIRPHPLHEDLESAMSSMRFRLNHPMEQDISQVFENAVKQIVAEGRPAEKILPAADRRIDALLKRKE